MNEIHHKVRRPTEEIALANIAREANRLGVSQAEIIRRFAYFSIGINYHSSVCHCAYCRRQRMSFAITSASISAN